MAKIAQYVPISTPYGWMVSIPPKLTASGKRVKKYFQTETEALKYAGKLRARHEAGERGGLVTATLAMEAKEASRVLEGSGISLIEAARIAMATAGGMAVRETFKACYERMLMSCEEHWSARYTRDMGKMERWVGKAMMGRKCGELSAQEIERCIRENGASAISTVRCRCRYAMAVLNFKDRVKRTAAGVEILSEAEVVTVLDACQCEEDRWVVALLVFAGIRPDAQEGEIARMRWEAVGKREIYLAPEMTKTKTDRHVPVLPRLAHELAGHPLSGRVVPARWKVRWQAIRKAAGIAAKQDVLRHTFASHFLAAYGEDAAKQAMGHTRGSDTLFRHYRRAVTREAGRRFFWVEE